MSIETHDMLDRALDAAEAQLKDETAPVESTPTESAPVDSAPSDRARDESGKFVKKEASKPSKPEEKVSSDQVVNVETQEPVAEETQSTPAVEAPTFWPAEHKALFAKAPRELQEVIAARELQLQQHVSRLTNENHRAKTFTERLYADMENDPTRINAHKSALALQGIRDEVDELHRYRAWDSVFKSDPRTAIADLMQKNGLTLYDFTEEAGFQPQYTDPRLEALEQQLQEQQRVLDEQKAAWEEQRKTAVLSELEQFKQGKDSTGQVRSHFVDLYEPQITQVFEFMKQNYPQLSKAEALNHAYEHVVGEARKAFNVQSTPPVKEPAKVIEHAKKAQAAASSPKGAPISGTGAQKARLKGNSFSEKLDSALDNVLSNGGF